LRAQLRHINNFTEILIEHLQGTMDNQSRHYLDVISHAASEMNILIDQLLYLFRIGISAASIERVDLNVLVNRVVNSFGQETVDRQIEWDIDNLPDVSGDLEMLQTVFSCLVSNALKFTRLQPVAKIKIAVEPGLADNSNVVLSIEDNGLGFDMQHKDKIFDMFQRMHNQKDFEGTGIGLANVKRIIQRHGGSVWAEGELNKGAKFYISLPKFENH
jgi:light-regulated signal transduction histidine kinase (bacteriophytochrome)